MSSRRSIFERLGPPAVEPAPKFASDDEPELLEKGKQGGGRGRTVQIHARSKLSVVVTQDGEPPGAAPAPAHLATPQQRLAGTPARVTPTRLLLHSLQQAQRSRGQQQRCSPRSTAGSQPSRSTGAGPNREQGRRSSPSGSSSSGSSGGSRGGSRQGRTRAASRRRGGSPSPPPPGNLEGLGGVAGAHAERRPAAAGPRAAPRSQAELQQRLEELRAERRVAEELAEQVMRQAEALMAEKARVQAENSALQKERENLLERLEFMEQVAALEPGGPSPAGSPVKGGAAAQGELQALRQQLQRMQQEREELLGLLEASLGGLQPGEEQRLPEATTEQQVGEVPS